jgi:hypothetical protein
MDQAKQTAGIVEQHRRDQAIQVRMNLLSLSLDTCKSGMGEFTHEKVIQGAREMLVFINDEGKALKLV